MGNTLKTWLSWKDWDESAHPRGKPDNAGQFTSGGGGFTSTENDDTEEEEEEEEKPEWDGTIDEDEISQDRGRDSIATYNSVNQGNNYPVDVFLITAAYDFDPDGDNPDTVMNVYRWESRDQNTGDRIENGEWTIDIQEARDTGRQHARNENEDEVEPDEEDEEDEEESESDDEILEKIDSLPQPEKRAFSLAKEKLPKSKAGVSVSPKMSSEEEEIADKIIGKFFGTDDIGDAYDALSDSLGMPDDAEIVLVKAGKYQKLFSDDTPIDAIGVRVSVKHPKMGHVSRFIGVDSEGKRFIRNEIVEIKEKYQGEGMGADIFSRQVESAAENGVEYIQTHAARGQSMNGYYTWPRFGYNMSLEDKSTKKDQYVFGKAREKFPDAESILDIFKTKEGREWWKTYGTDLHNAQFDLKEGSRSLEVLAAYVQERQEKKAKESRSTSRKIRSKISMRRGINSTNPANNHFKAWRPFGKSTWVEDDHPRAENTKGAWATLEGGQHVFIDDGEIKPGGPTSKPISFGKWPKSGEGPSKPKETDAESDEDSSAIDGRTLVPKPNESLPDQARPKLNKTEKKSVARYVGTIGNEEGVALNKAIRNGSKMTPEQEELNKGMQAAFAKVKDFPKPVTCYRGLAMGKEDATKIVKAALDAKSTGKPMQVTGYISTTTDKSVQESGQFGKIIRYEIQAYNGLDTGAVDDDGIGESELLLNHGSKFRVSDVKTEKDANGVERHTIQMEQLSPGESKSWTGQVHKFNCEDQDMQLEIARIKAKVQRAGERLKAAKDEFEEAKNSIVSSDIPAAPIEPKPQQHPIEPRRKSFATDDDFLAAIIKHDEACETIDAQNDAAHAEFIVAHSLWSKSATVIRMKAAIAQEQWADQKPKLQYLFNQAKAAHDVAVSQHEEAVRAAEQEKAIVKRRADEREARRIREKREAEEAAKRWPAWGKKRKESWTPKAFGQSRIVIKDFREEDHPRADDGKFGSGGGSGQTEPKKKPSKEDRAAESERKFDELMAKKTPADAKAFRKAKSDGVAIPPAWTEVTYYGKDKDILAQGRDDKGRRQRAENPQYRQRISDENNARITNDLAPRMPELRKELREDAESGNEEAKVLYLISLTGFRIGGKGDGKAKSQAFGASTLTGDHVSVDGDTVTFDFPGKKGVRQQHKVTDPVVAEMMAGAQPGKPIFNTKDTKIRAAWQDKYGGEKVHDIRHVVASEVAHQELDKLIPPPPSSEAKKKALIKMVATTAAEKLGNDPAQTLGTYIDPRLWDRVKVAA